MECQLLVTSSRQGLRTFRRLLIQCTTCSSRGYRISTTGMTSDRKSTEQSSRARMPHPNCSEPRLGMIKWPRSLWTSRISSRILRPSTKLRWLGLCQNEMIWSSKLPRSNTRRLNTGMKSRAVSYSCQSYRTSSRPSSLTRKEEQVHQHMAKRMHSRILRGFKQWVGFFHLTKWSSARCLEKLIWTWWSQRIVKRY